MTAYTVVNQSVSHLFKIFQDIYTFHLFRESCPAQHAPGCFVTQCAGPGSRLPATDPRPPPGRGLRLERVRGLPRQLRRLQQLPAVRPHAEGVRRRQKAQAGGCWHLRPLQVLQRRQGRVQEEVSPWQERGRVSEMYKPVSKEIISNDWQFMYIFLPILKFYYCNLCLFSPGSLSLLPLLILYIYIWYVNVFFMFFASLLSVSTNHDRW